MWLGLGIPYSFNIKVSQRSRKCKFLQVGIDSVKKMESEIPGGRAEI